MTNTNDDYVKIYMPMLRRVMPNIIASDIIGTLGTQPMSNANLRMGASFGLRSRPEYVPMNKFQYKQFLRLNDRKKLQREADFLKARYPYYDAPPVFLHPGDDSVANWMEKTMKDRYVWFTGFSSRIYFENEEDRLMFILRWA